MAHPYSFDWLFEFFGKRGIGSPENPPTPVSSDLEPNEVELDIQSRSQPRQRRDFDLQSQEAHRLFVFGSPSLSGVSVNNDTALTLPPFFGAVRYISEGIAMLDRKVKKRKDSSFVLADNHPISHLINERPHPDYTWFDFLSALITNACLGNGYARIWWDYETMRPKHLEHIPQGMVWPEYDQNGVLWYRVAGELHGRMVSWVLPRTDVIHIKGFTTNAIVGRPTALVHRPTLGAGIAAQQYTESIFGKGARPSIAIKTKDELLANEVQQIEDGIMNRHGGSENAGRPLVLDNGMDVVYLQWSPVDVALVDFRRLNVEDVSMITLVPVDMLVSSGKTGTYGASVQKAQNFLTHCLGPWIEKFQEEFNSKTFLASERRGGRVFFEFDTSMYLSMDKKSEAEVLRELVAGSIITPNEARERLGMAAAEGGDVLFGSINQLPIKDVAQIALAKYLSAAGEALQIKPDGDVLVSGNKIEQEGVDPQNPDQKASTNTKEDGTTTPGQSAAN